jgi:hypothetical protein
MKTLLALDLESTIIPHWNQMDTYINFNKLDAIVAEFQPEDWLIYSYAVWNDENYQTLRASQLIKDLSAKSKSGYISIETTQGMAEDWAGLHRHNYIKPNGNTIWSQPKEFAFLMTVRRMMQAGLDYKRYVLFDDTAPHNLRYKIDDVEVVFLNPENME